jgi:hypothetical protein
MVLDKPAGVIIIIGTAAAIHRARALIREAAAVRQHLATAWYPVGTCPERGNRTIAWQNGELPELEAQDSQAPVFDPPDGPLLDIIGKDSSIWRS